MSVIKSLLLEKRYVFKKTRSKGVQPLMFSIFRGKPSDFYHNHNFFNIKLTPDYTLDIRLPITRDHKINEKR